MVINTCRTPSHCAGQALLRLNVEDVVVVHVHDDGYGMAEDDGGPNYTVSNLSLDRLQ